MASLHNLTFMTDRFQQTYPYTVTVFILFNTNQKFIKTLYFLLSEFSCLYWFKLFCLSVGVCKSDFRYETVCLPAEKSREDFVLP